MSACEQIETGISATIFLMTPEEREEMRRLVDIIQTEKNHSEFMKAVHRMNELIGAKERRISPTAEQDENAK